MRFIRFSFCFCIVALTFSVTGQDSLNMERVGVWNPPNMPDKGGLFYNDVWGYTASDGSEYGIIGGVDSILVINVSDPANPVREFAYHGGDTVTWRDFKVHQNYLYGVCDGNGFVTEGLHIFDMSALPGGNITHVATIDTFFKRAHNIYIDTSTQKLYAAGSNTVWEGLAIIDISTPDVPVRIQNVFLDQEANQPELNFYVHDLYVKNDTAYCSHGNLGYYVWDLTDLNNIEILGSYDSPGYNHSSWIDTSGVYGYYAEEVPLGRPLAVMDLTNLGEMNKDIELIKTFKDPISNTATNVTPHNPFVKEDSLIISYYEDGVKVYELSDPENPDLIAYYDTYPDNGSSYTGYEGAWGTYPFLPSGHILVSDIKYGLNIIKVQNCGSPTQYYKDADGDGFGDPNVSEMSCSDPPGWVIDNTDCNDNDPEIFPGATEICDGVDNDCDNLIDDEDPGVVLNTYYLDSDNDEFGDNQNSVMACSPPAGYVVDNTDCDDSNNMINPNFPEICDGLDNDCSGEPEDDTSIEWYLDNDSDGYGQTSISVYQCIPPDGYSAFPEDCDDNDSNNYPGNIEVCDGQDNDCDGVVDEGCPPEDCDDVSLYINPITMSVYRAEIDIVSDAIVENPESIEFYAGSHLDLDPGFEVEAGAEFLAAIEECQNSGNILDLENELEYFSGYTVDTGKDWIQLKVLLISGVEKEFKFFNYSDLLNTIAKLEASELTYKIFRDEELKLEFKIDIP